MNERWGHVVMLRPREVRDDHKGESSVHAMWQDVTHTADAVEAPWNRLLQSQTGEFATVESWVFVAVSTRRADVSAVWDFWAATNSWALTGHSRIGFIYGRERRLQTGHTPLRLQWPSHNVSRRFLFSMTSYSNYPTSAFFVLSLTEMCFWGNTTRMRIKGTE